MSTNKTPRAFHEQNPNPEGRSWLSQYVHHQRYTESPTQFHFWTGVSVLAGALRRKVWIDQRQFEWTPNMYIILVGPAGVAAKSTTMRSGASLLEAVEGVHFGPQSVTWQALIDSFVKAQQIIELPGTTTNVTMSSLTIAVGELGTFFRPENKEFVDLLTAMWDGQKETLRRTTVGRGDIVVRNPWLNIIACTTPSWLKDNFPEGLVGGGLTSRIVFVYGDRKTQLVPYPSQLITDEDYEREKQFLLHDLRTIAELVGEYRLTPGALSWGEKWYAAHNNGGLPAHLTSGRFDGYIARKQTHIHKLAMVLAASKRSDLTITETDLREAEERISALEHDMIKVFDSIGVSRQAAIDTEVLKLIKNHKTINWKHLWKQCYGVHDLKVVKESVEAAIAAGYIKKEPTGDGDTRLTYLGGKRA